MSFNIVIYMIFIFVIVMKFVILIDYLINWIKFGVYLFRFYMERKKVILIV